MNKELEAGSLEIIEKMMYVLVVNNELELANKFSDKLMEFSIENNPSEAIKLIIKSYLVN